MTQVHILDSVSVFGENVLSEARMEVRKFRKLNCKIPMMRIKGSWTRNGFDFDFEEWEDAFPPLGHQYLVAGPKRAKVAPTATSELEVFFVHSGEGITDKNPLATGDLFEVEPVVEETDATEPADDDE